MRAKEYSADHQGSREWCPQLLPAPTVILRDLGLWSGFRLERLRMTGNNVHVERPLASHCIVLRHEALDRMDVRRPDDCRAGGHYGADVCIVPAWVNHSAMSAYTSGASEIVTLSIAPKILDHLARQAGKLRFELRFALNVCDAFISSALLALEADVRVRSPSGAMYGEAIALAIANHLVNCFDAAGDLAIRTDFVHDAAHTMRDYIEAHVDEPILLSDLARIAGIELHSVTRTFKTAFGTPPHQYIIHRRVEHAKQLLKGCELSIIDVALRSGFSSHSHFTRVFSKVTRLSPSQYQKLASTDQATAPVPTSAHASGAELIAASAYS